ncbi:UNVERIFIED_ORG: hypothetical protein E4P37_10285 [Bacillus sp. AZ43]
MGGLRPPPTICSAEGFVTDGRPVVLAWTESTTTSSRYRRELVSTSTTTPPFPGAHDFVRTSLARLGYDFGPFHLRFVPGPSGPRPIELVPVLSGVAGPSGIDAVTGSDTADDAVVRLLGDSPATGVAAAVAASTLLRFSWRTREPGRPPAELEQIGGMPGFVAAELAPDRSGQVLTVGTTPEQSARRARTAAGILRGDTGPAG